MQAGRPHSLHFPHGVLPGQKPHGVHARRPQHLHDGGPVGEVRPDFEGPPPDSVVHRLPLTPPRHHSLGVSRGPGPGVGPDEKTQLMLICSAANSSNYSVG